MEIIDRVSRTLGLSEKDGKKEVEMSTKEELPNAEPEQKESPIQPPPLSERKVVDFNSAISARDNLMSNNNTAKPMVKSKITTVRPKNFDDDAKVIADCLREDVPVIINLEDTNPEHARRIIDFALGTTYAIDGDVQMVNKDVFVCTPKSVMVIANKEEPKQERDFSWLTRKM
ncbi:MAG: cell division protein SepF [Selenomonadaceae bacterium]|nr:cell division protein SepF [Selenomonadaceae bacterium]MBQ7493266.1 cell division protein SepF [Selenomonadaceae bacterium]